MEEDTNSAVKTADIGSGESGKSTDYVSDKATANKGGQPKHHFDLEDLFNPTFRLEHACFCEDALTWLCSRPDTMQEIVSHKKRDLPECVTDEAGRAAF